MRPCSACVTRRILCQISEASDHCVECYRTHRQCELTSPIAEVERLSSKAEVLRERRLEAERTAIRLRKQEKALHRKMRELGAREEQNILELEMEEAAEEVLDPSELPSSAPALGVPPSPAGFSQISFGSLDRTSPVPTGSS
jgi:glycine/D-amino acid oxidase-like deaminating enzyme